MSTTASSGSTAKTTTKTSTPELKTVPDPDGPIDATTFDPLDEYGVEAIISETPPPEEPEPEEESDEFDPDEENGAEGEEAQENALVLGSDASA